MSKKYRSDMKRLKKMKDKDIDFSDSPETDEAFWADAELVMPAKKKPVYIRLDPDVLEWFRSLGKGYQTKINSVLRNYMEHHRK